jgi:hypothetical protein
VAVHELSLADERKDEISRLSRRVEQLVARETSHAEVERQVDRLTIAMFGHPQVDGDGLVSDVRTIREHVEGVTSGIYDKLERLYLGVLTLAGCVLTAAVVIAIAVH